MVIFRYCYYHQLTNTKHYSKCFTIVISFKPTKLYEMGTITLLIL